MPKEERVDFENGLMLAESRLKKKRKAEIDDC